MNAFPGSTVAASPALLGLPRHWLGNAIGPEYSIESPLTASLIALLLVRVDGRGVRPIGTALAVGAGAAMAALLVCGASPSRAGELWGAALVAMAAAITISLRSPLLGALVVAELCGDPKVLPLTIVAAVVASVADHGFVAAAKRLAGKGVPAVVDDADG